MSLFAGPGVLISIPGREALGPSWRASLMEVEEALGMLSSPDLRLAMHLVRDAALRRGVPVRCVVRPEVFDNRAARFSIFERAQGFSRHVCLTDGETVKLLAGLENYLFFYGSAFSQSLSALDRLRRRAPELMWPLRGQINSALAFADGRPARAPCLVLTSDFLPFQPVATLRSIAFGDFAPQAGDPPRRPAAPAADIAERYERLRYAPLTEAALADGTYGRVVADMILDACFDPTTLLILRAPFLRGGGRGGEAGLARRMAPLREALARSGVIVPRSQMANILVADGDLDARHPVFRALPTTVYVPDTFDFWRHAPGFFAAANRVVVIATQGARLGGATAGGPADGSANCGLTAIYGPRAKWLAASA